MLTCETLSQLQALSRARGGQGVTLREIGAATGLTRWKLQRRLAAVTPCGTAPSDGPQVPRRGNPQLLYSPDVVAEALQAWLLAHA